MTASAFISRMHSCSLSVCIVRYRRLRLLCMCELKVRMKLKQTYVCAFSTIGEAVLGLSDFCKSKTLLRRVSASLYLYDSHALSSQAYMNAYNHTYTQSIHTYTQTCGQMHQLSLDPLDVATYLPTSRRAFPVSIPMRAASS